MTFERRKSAPRLPPISSTLTRPRRRRQLDSERNVGGLRRTGVGRESRLIVGNPPGRDACRLPALVERDDAVAARRADEMPAARPKQLRQMFRGGAGRHPRSRPRHGLWLRYSDRDEHLRPRCPTRADRQRGVFAVTMPAVTGRAPCQSRRGCRGPKRIALARAARQRRAEGPVCRQPFTTLSLIVGQRRTAYCR
jgi:hypothetical protein